MPNRFVHTLALIALAVAAAARADTPVYGYRIVHTYPHDPTAYTEGLFYKNGYLYESTGGAGELGVRKVNLQTGKFVQRYQVQGKYFGEGIVDWKDQLIQVTWKDQQGFVYDLNSFKPLRSFAYSGEGWGLTRDDQRLYLSDGSPVLRILDPETLETVSHIIVTDADRPMANLNELEWVKGEIYANVWMTNRIARIDPASGRVTGWIDLTGLFDSRTSTDPTNDVLNGIAYDAARDRLFVTGKRWPKLFEITLVAPGTP
jgi:glutaminyl-peptide cyclotransferase